VVERSLLGVLLIALVASSCIYLAFIGGERKKLSVLEIAVPGSMFYSQNEYRVAVSLLARKGIEEAEIRLHWLRGQGKEPLQEIRDTFGIKPFDGDAETILLSIPLVADLVSATRNLSIEPTFLDERISMEGRPHRLIVVSVGLAQEAFMPERIGPAPGERPLAIGDYAVLMNASGQLVQFYSGYPHIFYDPERTVKSLEIDRNREKTIYENRTPESSLPGLRQLPRFGRVRLGLGKGDRMDVLLSLDGRTLRAWCPDLCVVEIWADGQRQEVCPFLIR